MTGRFEIHARTVTLLTFASRITGLARDAAISRVFGTTPVVDAFFFAFLIPNLFRRLFGEGALSAAFLPVYSRLNRDNPAIARQLASLTFGMLVLGLGAIVLVGEVVLFALSAREDHGNLALWLTMIMLPYMPMVCLVAMLGAMLQVHGRFGPTAAAPMLLNLFIVAAAVGLTFVLDTDDDAHRVAHIGMVAASVILAGVIQVAWSMLALRRVAISPMQLMRLKGASPSAWASMRSVLYQAVPMMLGLGVLQLNTLFDGIIASYPTVIGETIFGYDYPLEQGAMATVSYAQRLYQFPLGVFGIAVATAIFPLLASLSGDDDGFVDALRRGLRLVIFIGLPASAGLMLVREPLTATVLQGGEFTLDDTRRVGLVLLGYAPAIWAYSMVHVLTRAFYARSDARTPVLIAVSVVVLNLALNLLLIWPLAEAGLAWSTAICSVVQVILLLMMIRRHVRGIVDRSVVIGWCKTAVATAVMAGMVALIDLLMGDGAMWQTWSGAVLRLSVLVSAGGIVMLVAARAMNMRELAWALGRTG